MNLQGRSFLKLLDYTEEEIRYLLDLSHKLKQEKKEGIQKPYLKGKNISVNLMYISLNNNIFFI